MADATVTPRLLYCRCAYAQVAKMLEDDFKESRPMTLKELNEQSFWHRFAVRAARLTAPVQ